MLISHLPRLMLALMLLSIVGLGYVVKRNQTNGDFAGESFSGTTFDRS